MLNGKCEDTTGRSRVFLEAVRVLLEVVSALFVGVSVSV
jgi:hypothetical protein